MPSLKHSGSEFKARLVYRESSRMASATQRHPVSKRKKKINFQTQMKTENACDYGDVWTSARGLWDDGC